MIGSVTWSMQISLIKEMDINIVSGTSNLWALLDTNPKNLSSSLLKKTNPERMKKNGTWNAYISWLMIGTDPRAIR